MNHRHENGGGEKRTKIKVAILYDTLRCKINTWKKLHYLSNKKENVIK